MIIEFPKNGKMPTSTPIVIVIITIDITLNAKPLLGNEIK
jgi:hypothetical protein